MVAYFVITLSLAPLGLDVIICTLITDTIISVLGLLYMRQLPACEKRPLHASYGFYIGSILVFAWLFSQITATYFLTNYQDVGFDAYETVVSANPTAYILLSLVFAPVAEEILMRGVIFRSLKQAMPIGLAYAISSVVFALFHGTLVHIIVGIVCGLLFAVVYEYTGDIRCNILAHMVYNALSIVLGGVVVLPDVLFSPWVFGFCDLILCGVILYELIRVGRIRKVSA